MRMNVVSEQGRDIEQVSVQAMPIDRVWSWFHVQTVSFNKPEDVFRVEFWVSQHFTVDSQYRSVVVRLQTH